MRKPRAVIINETEDGKKQITELLNGIVKGGGEVQERTSDGKTENVKIKASGLDFDISSEEVQEPESLRSNSRLLGAQVYFIHEEKEDKTLAPRIAEALVERGAKSGMTLTTEGTTEEPYEVTRAQAGYKHFEGWLPKKETGKRFKISEVADKIDELRKTRKLVQPISIGIIGLGKLGRGCMVESSTSESISNVHVFSGFVQKGEGSYEELIRGQELPIRQAEKIIPHDNLEGIVGANPDVLVICTGKHKMNYNVPNRQVLNRELFQTGLPKVIPVLEAIAGNNNFQGLIAMQSNPNGHLIKYVIDPINPEKGKDKGMGIPVQQITSFPPDSIRFASEVFRYLIENCPAAKVREIKGINLIAPGDHPSDGGIPLYDEATVLLDERTGKTRPLLDMFPELKDPQVQESVNTKARSIGLTVVQTSEKYERDYKGVPQRVIECLEDISCFQQYSRYPIYSGLLTVPVQFVYEPENGNKMHVRVKQVYDTLPQLTKDKEILRLLRKDVKRTAKQTRRWLKEMGINK